MHRGVCDGAILRARLNTSNPTATIEPFSWGYRNGYAIRFAPENHALKGGLLVGEDGADERGARPSNNAPDVLSLAQQNKDGTPDYHGWPDRFGFLASSQAVYNPIGGPADDVPVSPADVPIRDVLAFPPQPITSPLALEAADSSFTGIDFVPNSFAVGPVNRGAALYSLEGDFGFSAPNATAPAPEVGHEIKLINFSKVGEPLVLKIINFARNATGDQAFIQTTAQGQAGVQSSAQRQIRARRLRLDSQTTVRCETSEQTPISKAPRPMVRCFRFRELASFGGSARRGSHTTTMKTMIDLM